MIAVVSRRTRKGKFRVQVIKRSKRVREQEMCRYAFVMLYSTVLSAQRATMPTLSCLHIFSQ